ncbi:PARP catalytic domain-containing protein [Mycena sanguinolenta]|uniref:Poly [ADP-ribose] polymerase n=1 Tax=Mycena sanguinolenta TaxID=230812 RepID=A0A8H6ZJV2_9AGAR|nr:PARP catalytic domain-containing protein [Mycena sanguinolenta]
MGRSSDPPLVALSKGCPTYIQLKQYFEASWIHPNKPKPLVHAIFAIGIAEESLVPFLEYRASVGHCSMSGYGYCSFAGHANEHLLFHGTRQTCRLGDDERKPQLCKETSCSLCSIIRNSFDVSKCGKEHAFSRFGTGIYTTECSSKADDYSSGHPDPGFHTVLVNQVVVGNPLVQLRNARGITEPPSGYNSIVGVPGADLNYGETVVYDDNAIRPVYLIAYSTDYRYCWPGTPAIWPGTPPPWPGIPPPRPGIPPPWPFM